MALATLSNLLNLQCPFDLCLYALPGHSSLALGLPCSRLSVNIGRGSAEGTRETGRALWEEGSNPAKHRRHSTSASSHSFLQFPKVPGAWDTWLSKHLVHNSK